jgi:uncharacterized protein
MEEQVTFAAGEIWLEGLLSMPTAKPAFAAVLCHPHPLYGGDMHNAIIAAMAEEFQAAGAATLRFNFRGVGDSGGRHDDGRGELDDVGSAVTCLLSRVPIPTVAVAGYSFGAMTGLRAGSEDPRVGKLIGVALPIASRDCAFLQTVGKPILLISGDRDDYCPISVLQPFVAKLGEPKSLIVIDGADHFFAGWETRVAKAATAFLTD